MKRFVLVTLVAIVLFALTGCVSQQVVSTKLQDIMDKHGVIVKVENPMSRFALSGNLVALLEQIDADLEKCPQFFKANIGPVIIEESFIDNANAWPLPMGMRGYVSVKEENQRFPVHIKNRSLMEKTLLFAPRDDELFLHEASHSFEFNVGTHKYEQWLRFYNEFGGSSNNEYGGIVASLITMALPLPPGAPDGYASFYASVNHLEDFAETHCYLRRHDIEQIKEKDPVLYQKCKAVEKFVAGQI